VNTAVIFRNSFTTLSSGVTDPDPHQIVRYDLDPNPHQSDSYIGIRIILQMTSQNVWKMSLFEHFFEVLSLYLEAGIRIWIKVKGRIRIRIRIRIEVKSRIRIRISGSASHCPSTGAAG
jgi:hypothetical protein